MGNKLVASPFPSYESAVTYYSPSDLAELKEKFSTLSGGLQTISLSTFHKRFANNPHYIQKHLCPRIFTAFDTKKDAGLDFEEYLCAMTVMKSGTVEEKSKCVYLMYEGSKGNGTISKDNFKQMMVDSCLISQNNEIPVATTEQWIADMKGLSQATAEGAFVLYAANPNKMEMPEFLLFARNDSSVKAFFSLFITALNI